MTEFLVGMALFVLFLAFIGWVADWWESPARRDSRSRNHVSRPRR